MKYILLIYVDEKVRESLPPEESRAMMPEYAALTQAIKDAGQYRAGEALQPSGTTTTVRVRGGALQTTDGPFVETREQLGGFYVVDAANLDEAIALAARIPGARTGCVEVRPCVVFAPDASLPGAVRETAAAS